MHIITRNHKHLADRLVGRRKQFTKGCRIVLEALKNTQGTPSAQDIALQLKNSLSNQAPGLTTVYRSLELLARLGIVQVVTFRDGERRYELISPGEHFHHLICEQCGKTTRISACIIDGLAQSISTEYSFMVKSHVLELYGLCKQCNDSTNNAIPNLLVEVS
jgi:Fur family ferric uptake transcriptional regulator